MRKKGFRGLVSLKNLLASPELDELPTAFLSMVGDFIEYFSKLNPIIQDGFAKIGKRE
jgi:hypothetical protein